MTVTYSKEQVAEAISLIKQGIKYSEITAKTGLSRGALTYYAKKEGIQRGNQLSKPLAPEKVQEIRELFQAGVPIKDIIKQTGCSDSVIYKYTSGSGLKPRVWDKQDQIKKAIEMYLSQQDRTVKDICKEVDIHPKTLYQALKKLDEESK
ncbi:helix-turn-helix domain-containing protein [Neobacillus vireti]|uniref:helix-turn-helix domain-containing protein n=1 Tax=Neobacillus vireti TaxID=220686 RepID=UPI0030001F70